MSVMTSNAQIL